MVTVYLEKHGKVLVGKLKDKIADAVLDYVSINGEGEVVRSSSNEIFGRDGEKHSELSKICKGCFEPFEIRKKKNQCYCDVCATKNHAKRHLKYSKAYNHKNRTLVNRKRMERYYKQKIVSLAG